MQTNHQDKLSRRRFLKSVGAGAVAVSLGSLGPYVLGQEPLRIGMANPMATFFGLAAQKAALLAIDEINKTRERVLGRTLELVISDSAGRPDQALRAVQELVLSKRANVLTGFFFSEELLGAMPVFPVLQKIFLGTGASSAAATLPSGTPPAFSPAQKFFFRVGPTNSFFLVDGTTTFFKTFMEDVVGWKSIVVFAENAAWTAFFTANDAANVKALLAAKGSKLKVVDVIAFDEATTDFTTLFNRAVARVPAEELRNRQAGFFTVLAHTGVRPTSQWRAQQVPLPMVGINSQAPDQRFDKLTGGAAESVATLSSGGRAKITDKTIPFFDNFGKFTAFEPEITIPSYNAYYTYDAIYLLKDAIERAGVLPDSPANTDKVIEALEKSNFVGTTGPIRFYQKDEIVEILGLKVLIPHDVKFAQVLGEPFKLDAGASKERVLPASDELDIINNGPGAVDYDVAGQKGTVASGKTTTVKGVRSGQKLTVTAKEGGAAGFLVFRTTPAQTGVWVQWQSGKLEVIFPREIATANFVLPPWMRP
ncbi:MAG: ABC transporter substrate-binding protein [Candidatus Bipolaricaulia bacterium]